MLRAITFVIFVACLAGGEELICEEARDFWQNPRHIFDKSPAAILSQEPLGKGSFGTVYACKYNGEPSVLKVIEFDPRKPNGWVQAEVAIQPYIADLSKVVLSTACVVGTDYVGLVMPRKGSSLSKLRPTISKMPFPEQVRVFIKIVQAVGEIGSAGVVHNDLKPSNIIAARGDLRRVTAVWLIDFGMSCLYGAACSGGTLSYSPPEKINAGMRNRGDYAVDAWALIVIIIDLYGNIGTRGLREMLPAECWKRMSQACHAQFLVELYRVLARAPRWFQTLLLSGLAYHPGPGRIGAVELGTALLAYYRQAVRAPPARDAWSDPSYTHGGRPLFAAA